MKTLCKEGTNRWRKYDCYTEREMCQKTSATEMQFASTDRCQRGRCKRAEEAQLCCYPLRPLERAVCRRRAAAAAASLDNENHHRAFYSTFAIATRPLLLLKPALCRSAALRIETPPVSRRHPRRLELPRGHFAGTMRIHCTFQLACWGGPSIFRKKQ